jgi:RNA 2',3'-cyclic 3'-phosphodiesterase
MYSISRVAHRHLKSCNGASHVMRSRPTPNSSARIANRRPGDPPPGSGDRRSGADGPGGTSRGRPRRAHQRTGTKLAGSARRLFFGLWPPADVLAALSGWVIAIPAAHRSPADQLHLTVLFLGAVPNAALPQLLAAAAQVRCDAIDQPLDRLEYWPTPRVLCAVGSTSAALLALRSQLLGVAAAAGLNPPDAARPLLAHVTLARRRHTPPPEPGLRPTMSFTASSFSLIESRSDSDDEQRYVSLADWPLVPSGSAPVLR